jgi:hypothetical protein
MAKGGMQTLLQGIPHQPYQMHCCRTISVALRAEHALNVSHKHTQRCMLSQRCMLAAPLGCVLRSWP